MKFSVLSLLILIALSALVLLSVRSRQRVSELQLRVVELQTLTEAQNREYLIAKTQSEICEQVFRSPMDHNMPHAEANFRALQKRKLDEPIENPEKATILRIPMVGDLGDPPNRLFRYRLYVPSGQRVELHGEVSWKNGPIQNTKLFRPSSVAHEISSGEFLIDIRVEQPTGLIMNPGQSGEFRFHVSVMPKDGASEDTPEFNWVTAHQEKEAPRHSATDFDGNARSLVLVQVAVCFMCCT